jgi:hypothetical protein
MNQALEMAIEKIETFKATRYRPVPIITEADIELAGALAGKRKKRRRSRSGPELKLKSFQPGANNFSKGLSFKYRNHYQWQLDITEYINVASPGYLAHLAGVPGTYSEPLRERWEAWCKDPANYIPQAIRMCFMDYWQAWVDAGELTRFKDDIFSRWSNLVESRFTDIFCLNPTCPRPGLHYQIRYTVVMTDARQVVDTIPTVDDKADPAGEAGRYTNGYAVVRRRCPWCGEHNVYWVEVESVRNELGIELEMARNEYGVEVESSTEQKRDH